MWCLDKNVLITELDEEYVDELKIRLIDYGLSQRIDKDS
jgi:hypothetical protein